MRNVQHGTDPYYQSSGRAPVGGVLLSLLMGLGAGVVVAFAYAYLLIYVPIAGYITFLFAAGFGFCAAFATSSGLSMGKVRSHAVTVIVVGIVALVSFYASWVAWTHGLLNKSNVQLGLGDVLAPGDLWRLVSLINENGAWTMFGGTPKGPVLWLLWGIEAAIILGSIVLFSGVLAPPPPFCEACNEWCEEHEGVVALAAPTDPTAIQDDRTRLVRHLESKDFRALEELGPPEDPAVFYRVDEHVCEGCNQTCLLSLSHVVLEVDEDGDLDEDVDPLMENLVVTAEERLALHELGERMRTLGDEARGAEMYPAQPSAE